MERRKFWDGWYGGLGGAIVMENFLPAAHLGAWASIGVFLLCGLGGGAFAWAIGGLK